MAYLKRDAWSFEKFNELQLQEFQALIVNYGSGTVLLKREDSRWILPAYVGDEESYESCFLPQFVIERIQLEIGLFLDMCVLRQLWRKEMTVVRNREHSAVEKAVVLLSCCNCEIDNVHASIGRGYEWKLLGNVEIFHLFPEARRIITEETDRIKQGIVPSNRLKWQRPGWMEAKSTWIQDVLLRQEKTQLVKPLVTERSTSLGTVIEAHTVKGVFFMKCTPPWQNDAAYTEALSRTAPKYVAPPIAVDVREEIMITKDYGPILVPALFDDAERVEFTRDFTKFQLLVAEKVEEVIRAGMPDCRRDGLLKRMHWAAGRPMLDAIASRKVHAEAVHFFRTNLEQLKSKVLELYGSGIPSTVTHNDLYMSNVYKKEDGGGYVFFDWVEGYVSHPFAGVLDGLSFDDYLEQWKQYLQREDLDKVYKTAQKVRLIINLVLRMVEAENIEEPEAAEAVDRVAEEIQSVFECFCNLV